MRCRLSFNADLSVRPSWLPVGLGDDRFSVLEWWQSHRATVPKESWQQSRLHWLRLQWCLPHLLGQLWLLDDVDTTAVSLVLGQKGLSLDTSLENLTCRLKAWSENPNKTKEIQDIYGDFQLSLFCLGYIANVRQSFQKHCTSVAGGFPN